MIFFKKKDEIKKLKEYYESELKRRDLQIDELKKNNEILFKSALKSSQKAEDFREKLEKAIKLKKQ
jgi:hypothetical protein